jgi:hypothetical protein
LGLNIIYLLRFLDAKFPILLDIILCAHGYWDFNNGTQGAIEMPDKEMQPLEAALKAHSEKRYRQSELDALLQAANEAALREALSQVWDDWNAPIGDLASPYVAGTIADRIARLIPQPSALDKRLAEARLSVFEYIMNHTGKEGWDYYTELHRAVKGEPDA